MQIVQRQVADLVPYINNSRTHSDAQVAQVAASIKEFGWTNPILTDGEKGIIAGHGRLLAARKLGMTEVPVIELDGLTPNQKKAYIIADNKLALNAGWDDGILALELVDLQNIGFDLSVVGFSLDELNTLFAEPTVGLTDEDAVPDVPVEPVTKLGDVWLCGKHRVMCGDSTSIDAVEKLMDGQKASLVVTDPPWNVAYGTNIKKNNAMNYKVREIMNDNFTTTKEWENFLCAVVGCISVVTLPGCPLYCVMGPSEWPAIDKALRNNSFHWSSTIIWAKDQLVMSRKDYHTQYEPMWYGWKEGAARLWVVKDRKQSDLWQCARPKSSPLHPTTKPVELAERAILNSSNVKSINFEPFGGSGWMIIASEKTDRINRSMELDPKYCDVIVKRWQDFTGKTATLESNGVKFPLIPLDKRKAA